MEIVREIYAADQNKECITHKNKVVEAVRTIQFKKKKTNPASRKLFFIKSRPIHFHINKMNGQMKQVEFFQHWNQQATSSCSLWYLSGQIQIQKQ